MADNKTQVIYIEDALEAQLSIYKTGKGFVMLATEKTKRGHKTVCVVISDENAKTLRAFIGGK